MNLLMAFAFVTSALAVDWPDVGAPISSSSEGENDAAVIIAVEDYFQIPDVEGAVTNANDWRRFLARRGVPLANIHLIANGSATREAILEEAEWAAQRVSPTGRVWFVFIGHGAPSSDGTDGLLVGADAQGTARSLTARSVARSEVLERLQAGPQMDTIVLLDACFSGRLSGSDGQSIAEGLQPVIPTALAATGDVTVLSAGATDQFAGPLPGLSRPAFSYLALGALRGWGDTNGDGQVSALEVSRYAEGALSVLVTDRRQVPQLDARNPDLSLGRGTESGPDLLMIAEALIANGQPPILTVERPLDEPALEEPERPQIPPESPKKPVVVERVGAKPSPESPSGQQPAQLAFEAVSDSMQDAPPGQWRAQSAWGTNLELFGPIESDGGPIWYVSTGACLSHLERVSGRWVEVLTVESECGPWQSVDMHYDGSSIQIVADGFSLSFDHISPTTNILAAGPWVGVLRRMHERTAGLNQLGASLGLGNSSEQPIAIAFNASTGQVAWGVSGCVTTLIDPVIANNSVRFTERASPNTACRDGATVSVEAVSEDALMVHWTSGRRSFQGILRPDSPK